MDFRISNEEFREGIRAVGAPIFNMEGTVVGAIVIVAPYFPVAAQGFSPFRAAGEKGRHGDFSKNGLPSFPCLIAEDIGRK